MGFNSAFKGLTGLLFLKLIYSDFYNCFIRIRSKISSTDSLCLPFFGYSLRGGFSYRACDCEPTNPVFHVQYVYGSLRCNFVPHFTILIPMVYYHNQTEIERKLCLGWIVIILLATKPNLKERRTVFQHPLPHIVSEP